MTLISVIAEKMVVYYKLVSSKTGKNVTIIVNTSFIQRMREVR